MKNVEINGLQVQVVPLRESEPLDENEQVISLLVETIEAPDIWAASHKIKTIIDKLIPRDSSGRFTCEADVWEVERLQGFALRLLAKEFKAKKK